MKEKKKAYSEQEEKQGNEVSKSLGVMKPEDQKKAFWILKGMQMAREEEKVS